MTRASKTIVFFGSGPVAAKSLELLAKNFEIEAVVTKPRAPHHKGAVPVLSTAKHLDLPVLTVSNKTELDKIINKGNLRSNIGILIDFGIIVSRTVIDYFPLGIINSHFSLLPILRGADPITFSILNGDSETGVSLMIIDEGMDTGKLIAQKSLRLPKDITTPQLTDELILLSDELLCKFMPLYIKNQIKPYGQPNHQKPTYSKKITKNDGVINWNKPAQQIEREIRAYVGWPGSKTSLYGKEVTILKASLVDDSLNSGKPGDIQIIKKTKQLIVGCQSGGINIEQLRPSGKNKMDIEAFIAGYASNKPA